MPGPEASFIAGLVCIRGRLVQGNPLSPLVFLIVTLKLTQRLALLAEKNALVFTIYADNIAFSGESIPPRLAQEITAILREEGFSAHAPDDAGQRKNHLMGGSTGNKRIITGLAITPSGLALPVEIQEQAKADLERALSKGFIQKDITSAERERLRDTVAGRLVYATSLDRSTKESLEVVLSTPLKRRSLLRNLGDNRVEQIIRQVKAPQLMWEKLAK
ncbi:hypothetical protein D3C86_1248640 [compost metagenome]